MATTVQLIGGAFQDAEGNPVANGFLLFELSEDSRANSISEICSGTKPKILLDANGNIQSTPAQYIWPNDVLTPTETYYTVTGYKVNGQRVWGPCYQRVLSTPSPFDVGTWTPNAVTF